ncbi:rho GDP-dissociation inhibitor 1-like [Artemia franciscana]|uniref:Rho GDP-dissociation inhibitor 3 n=1 Tax=Artemia franciscana TaxID=6661 RepID=A0AA88HVH4_ARTSF|nr:hypothetical protein QYM36_012522 [Artemia franciscana]
MSSKEDELSQELEEELDLNYKAPPQKSLQELIEADKEDASLAKYKESLLGNAISGGLIVEPNDPRKVIVKKLKLVTDDGPTMELDLTGDLSNLKSKNFVVKEGISYRIQIDFLVQREIVHGLKYLQKTYKSIAGIQKQVDKMTHMVGSYPPKEVPYSYLTPAEDAPSGMLARGNYNITSLFTDDDGKEHLKWDWSFEIKKDWS